MENNVMSGIYKRNEEKVAFNYYTNLKMVDKIKFVSSVVDNVVNENNYTPLIKDMMFDFAIVDIFTDVDIEYINDTTDVISAIEDLLEETNVVDIVKANVDSMLIDELEKSINDNIAYKTGIHRNELNDVLVEFVKNINNNITSIDLDSMANVAEKIASISGDLSAEKLVNAYAESSLNAEK